MSLQTVLRNLLNDGFDGGEIDNLAFDLFQPVYQERMSGQSKSQIILATIDYATETGRIQDLINYIKRHRTYQYQRYEQQLKQTLDEYNEIESALKEDEDTASDVIRFYAEGKWDGGEKARRYLGWT